MGHEKACTLNTLLIEQNSIQIEIPTPACRISSNNESMSTTLVLRQALYSVLALQSRDEPIAANFLNGGRGCLLFGLKREIPQEI